jgi:hypothetical protein
MNGVTGRMGTNQHLIRSIKAIRDQGGLKVNDDLTLMPDPILTGRNHDKLQALAAAHGVSRFTTDVDAALANPTTPSSSTPAARCSAQAFREGREGWQGHLLRETDGGRNRRSAASCQALRRRGCEKRRACRTSSGCTGIRKFRCCVTRASLAASSACAASSATGSSPVKMATSPRSVRRGTTARKTAAASSSICSATGAM